MNFAEIARAMGCRGIRVEEPAQLRKELAEALLRSEPSVLDVVASRKTSYRDVMSPLAVPKEPSRK